MKYIISRTVVKVTADSVPLKRPFWNMSWQHAGYHEINVNTLNHLHKQGEAISPILKDAWCLDVNSLSTVIFHFVFRDHLTAYEWTGFNVLFGIFNAGEDFVIVNHLILEAKFYIYRCKLNGVKPAMRVLKTKIGAIHNIQGRIAFMRNTVEFHEKKMGKNQMLSQLSLFPPGFLPVCYCYLYISVVEYTYWFFFSG